MRIKNYRIIMNVLKPYRRSRFFLWINIIGLGIGLAVSIMLILFIVNELSYDKHFANHERIVRLNTISVGRGQNMIYGINLRKAYTELPAKVSGIEAATQIYDAGTLEVSYNNFRFQDLSLIHIDPEFFEIFQMKFIAGTAQEALADATSVVITNKWANTIFESAENAIGKTIDLDGKEVFITAVVEELPDNTHFSFDLLLNIKSLGWVDGSGLEFQTYYLIDANASFEDVRETIVKEYQPIIDIWSDYFGGHAFGRTEKLSDVYWSDAMNHLGKHNNISFVWLLSILAIIILLVGVANFVNLFIAQGKTRMREIGIRKTNGASVRDIVRQFFSEVFFVVLISFILGLFLTVLLTPYFSTLIQKDIEIMQLLNPLFILCVIVLFALTVVLAASYPSFYLSRFSLLDILSKQLRFSKRRVTVTIVILQSVVTIILMSYIWLIDKQTSYFEKMQLGYNPENVMIVFPNNHITKNYFAVKEELQSFPEIEMVSGAHHVIGSGYSGQGMALFEDSEKYYDINEYRIASGLCELMEFQLKEGEFFKENTSDSVSQIILNESAVRMLGLKSPVTGQFVNYRGKTQIMGVVKDFYYEEPSDRIEPLMLTKIHSGYNIYIKFNKNISKSEGRNIVSGVLEKFDPGHILNLLWSEDIYLQKFEDLRIQSKLILLASFFSMFIAMMGLLAVHLYATARRTKEIAIRRVNGALIKDIFRILSYDILKWIVVAGMIAIPITWYLLSEWLNNFANRTSLHWSIFIIPILIQCVIALMITSGVSFKASLRNPVDALKKE